MFKKNLIALSLALSSGFSFANTWTDFYNLQEPEYFPSDYANSILEEEYNSATLQGMYVDSNEINKLLNSSSDYSGITIIADTINIDDPILANISDLSLKIMARRIIGSDHMNLSIDKNDSGLFYLIADKVETDIHLLTDGDVKKIDTTLGHKVRFVQFSGGLTHFEQNDDLNLVAFIDAIHNKKTFLFDQAFDTGASIFDQDSNLSLEMLNWYSKALGQSQGLLEKNQDFTNLFQSLKSMAIFVTANQKSGDYLPNLNMDVYSQSYGTLLSAMNAYQSEYDQFEDQSKDLAARKQSAKLMLEHLESALTAQQGIIDNQNKKIEAYQQVIDDRTIEFEKQQDYVNETANGFREGIELYTQTVVWTSVFDCFSIISDLATGIISAYTGNVGEVADSAADMADKVQDTVFNAKNLKKLADNIANIKKMADTINKILQLVKDHVFNADLREQMNEINLTIPELESSSITWDLTKQDIAVQLGAAEKLGIRGTSAYRAALEKLMTWGSAISGTQLAMIQMSSRVIELELEKTVILEDIDRISALIDSLESDEEAMLEVEQYLLRSYNFFKRPLYSAQLNYNAAYKYTTFENSKVTPKLNASYLEYSQDRVTMQEQFNDYMSSLSEYAQVFRNSFDLNDADAIKSLRETGQFSISISPDNYTIFGTGFFEGEIRIRLETFGVELIGYDLPDTLYKFQISHTGQFTDLYKGKEFVFNGTLINKFFSYEKDGDIHNINQDGNLEEEFKSYTFKPSLMSNWTIKLKNHEDIDLSKVTNIKISLKGSSITTPWRKN